MGIPRLISLLLLAVGLYLLGEDVANLITGANPAPESLRSLWEHLDAGSLAAIQSFVEGHLAAPLWDPVMTTVLQLPAWTVPLALGVLALVADIFIQRRGG